MLQCYESHVMLLFIEGIVSEAKLNTFLTNSSLNNDPVFIWNWQLSVHLLIQKS